MTRPWRRVRLGEVIRHRKEFIQVDDFKSYKRCRVQSWARGIVLRDVVEGSKIKTKRQQVCRPGELLVAEIDAKVGGFGIVPPELDGALVSSHYFLFEIDDDRLSRDFLGYVLRTPEFQGQVGARGSTNYAAIRPGHVLDYEIPLPDRVEQDRIVARLDAVAAKVDEAWCLRAELATDARRVLESAFQRAIEGAPYRPMAEVAPLVRREVQVEPGGEYSEIGVRSFFKGVFVRRSMTGADFTWQRLFEVREGDLVFSNIMAWERAIGLATEDHAGCVGNHRMLTCEPRTYVVSPAFLYYYFTTEAGFAKIAAASPGTVARNKTLTASSLAQVDVPVPPLSVQLQFAEWSARVAGAEQAADDMAASTALLVDSAIQESFNAGER